MKGILLNGMDPDELRRLIQEVVKKELSATHPKSRLPKLLSQEEFMQLTGIKSPKTCQRLRERGEIAYRRIGRRILYPEPAVLEYLERYIIKRKSM